MADTERGVRDEGGGNHTSRGQNGMQTPWEGSLILVLAENKGALEEAFNCSLILVPEISSIIIVKIPNLA